MMRDGMEFLIHSQTSVVHRNITPQFTGHVITYPCCDSRYPCSWKGPWAARKLLQMGNNVTNVVSQLQQYIRVNTNHPNPLYGSLFITFEWKWCNRTKLWSIANVLALIFPKLVITLKLLIACCVSLHLTWGFQHELFSFKAIPNEEELFVTLQK